MNSFKMLVAAKRQLLPAFTLMEMMVVIILLGVIAAFAIPSYTKSVDKAHEQDIITQLQAIYSANVLYRAHNGTYWDTGGVAVTNLNTINSTLGINIIANDGTTYSYTGASGGASYSVYASRTALMVRLTQVAGPLHLDGTNPCCYSGICYILPSCP